MKSYRDLDIYKVSRSLAIEVHAETLAFPKFELYEEGIGDLFNSRGLWKAALQRDFIRYLIYAQSECDETIVHLDFLADTKSMMNLEKYSYLRGEYDTLSKRINRFAKWVENNLK